MSLLKSKSIKAAWRRSTALVSTATTSSLMGRAVLVATHVVAAAALWLCCGRLCCTARLMACAGQKNATSHVNSQLTSLRNELVMVLESVRKRKK